uniref:snRNA-activating protein complex subunit 4 n=1 Tax=Neogobius melanostomus TaxID=47308 RepID=A0A8C6U3N7_9GOBI
MAGLVDDRKLRIRRWEGWQKGLLIHAVFRDRLRKLIQPKLSRIDFLTQKLSSAPDSTKAQIQDQILALERDIQAIREKKQEEVIGGRFEDVDWARISNIDFEGSREASDLQCFWQNFLHPSINKERWTDDDIQRLKELSLKNQERNWTGISQELGTGRTAFMCLQTYQRFASDSLRKRRWTPEEDAHLRQLVDKMRIGNYIPYTQICYFMEDRLPPQLIYRWNHVLDPRIKKGPWSPQEDQLLLAAVDKHGAKNWWKIRYEVPGRTDSACRDRYLDCLRPGTKRGPFDYKERLLFRRLLQKHGFGRWAKIAAEIPNRTDAQCLRESRKLRRQMNLGIDLEDEEDALEEVVHEATLEEVVHEAMLEEVVHEATLEEVMREATLEEVVHEATLEEVVHEATLEEVVHEATLEEVVHEATLEEEVHVETPGEMKEAARQARQRTQKKTKAETGRTGVQDAQKPPHPPAQRRISRRKRRRPKREDIFLISDDEAEEEVPYMDCDDEKPHMDKERPLHRAAHRDSGRELESSGVKKDVDQTAVKLEAATGEEAGSERLNRQVTALKPRAAEGVTGVTEKASWVMRSNVADWGPALSCSWAFSFRPVTLTPPGAGGGSQVERCTIVDRTGHCVTGVWRLTELPWEQRHHSGVPVMICSEKLTELLQRQLQRSLRPGQKRETESSLNYRLQIAMAPWIGHVVLKRDAWHDGNTRAEGQDKDPDTPAEHQDKDPDTPAEHQDKDPDTPAEHQDKDPDTPAEHQDKDPDTPAEHQDKDPDTPAEHQDKDPDTPAEHQDKDPDTPAQQISTKLFRFFLRALRVDAEGCRRKIEARPNPRTVAAILAERQIKQEPQSPERPVQMPPAFQGPLPRFNPIPPLPLGSNIIPPPPRPKTFPPFPFSQPHTGQNQIQNVCPLSPVAQNGGARPSASHITFFAVTPQGLQPISLMNSLKAQCFPTSAPLPSPLPHLPSPLPPSPHLCPTSPHLCPTSHHLCPTSHHLCPPSPHLCPTSPHLCPTSHHLCHLCPTSRHLCHLCPTSHHLCPTSHHLCHLCPNSRHLCPTYRHLCPTSRYLCPTSRYLCPTSHHLCHLCPTYR